MENKKTLVVIGKISGIYENRAYYLLYFGTPITSDGDGNKPIGFRKGDEYRLGVSCTKECYDSAEVGYIYDEDGFCYDKYGKLKVI